MKKAKRDRARADGMERRLALRREIVRNLTERDLARVGGGAFSGLNTKCMAGSVKQP